MIFLTFLSFLTIASTSATKTLVILVDGFRWDYPDTMSTPNLDRMAKEGIRAEYVEPVFPSLSIPAWTTIVTGKKVSVVMK